MPRCKTYTREWLEELCKDSFSLAEVLTKAGRKQGGGNQSTLKNKIAEFGIDTSHFTGQGWKKGVIDLTQEEIDNLFKKNSTCQKIGNYRHIIVALKGYCKCEECGLTDWRGKEVVLEVHHVDGDKFNNEISNLQLLCPNCHSQTDNFRGRK